MRRQPMPKRDIATRLLPLLRPLPAAADAGVAGA